MKKIILLTIFLLGSMHSAQAMPFFADTIIDYSGGTGLDFTGDAHIARALGPADLVFISIGETGYITFAFDDLFLVNGTGSDVRIYTTSHSIFNEPADVSASFDGLHFLSLGILDQNRPYTFFGNGPDYSIYYEEFDLGFSGMNKARYLRVTDLSGGFVATDLDAVAILNSAPIPEPSSLLLLGCGLAGMGRMKRKVKVAMTWKNSIRRR